MATTYTRPGDAHPTDQRRPCRFCGSTRSAKTYTDDGDGVQCRNARDCIGRQYAAPPKPQVATVATAAKAPHRSQATGQEGDEMTTKVDPSRVHPDDVDSHGFIRNPDDMEPPRKAPVTHHVVGRVGGVQVAVKGTAGTNTEALAEYQRLDKAQAEGRLYRQTNAPRRFGWRDDHYAQAVRPVYDDWLAVRSVDDPQWGGDAFGHCSLPAVTLMAADSRKGAADEAGPASRVARRMGFTGSSGGWIRTIDPNAPDDKDAGRPVIQGWSAFTQRYVKPHEVFTDGTRWYANEAR